eukprot:SAG31_NODE_20011_length_586_cov_0.932238_1_plen_70_part_00
MLHPLTCVFYFFHLLRCLSQLAEEYSRTQGTRACSAVSHCSPPCGCVPLALSLRVVDLRPIATETKEAV